MMLNSVNLTQSKITCENLSNRVALIVMPVGIILCEDMLC